LIGYAAVVMGAELSLSSHVVANTNGSRAANGKGHLDRWIEHRRRGHLSL